MLRSALSVSAQINCHIIRVSSLVTQFVNFDPETFVFLAITIQMGHCIRDKLTDYWSRAENFYTSFYSNAMKWDRFFHILRFLHFTDNKNEPDMADENSDRLWKMRHLFDILNEKFSKFYSSSEHLAVDEVIAKYKGRVIFDSIYPRKTTFRDQNLQTV